MCARGVFVVGIVMFISTNVTNETMVFEILVHLTVVHCTMRFHFIVKHTSSFVCSNYVEKKILLSLKMKK